MKNELVIGEGVAIKFTVNDYYFCTQCYVYFLIDVIDAGNYYVTATASSQND